MSRPAGRVGASTEQEIDLALPEPLAGLVREHKLIEEMVLETRKGLAAASSPVAGAQAAEQAIELVRDLEAFAAVDLVLHIAKEEDVLFPVVRAAAGEAMEVILEDMFHQHDEIRDGSDDVRRVLEALDADHDELREGIANLASEVREAGPAPSVATLNRIAAQVRVFEALLQGHFLDEESNVFEPATGLLSPETFVALAEEMAALEAEYA